MLGPSSILNFAIQGRCDGLGAFVQTTDVEQVIDLSQASAEARISLRLSGLCPYWMFEGSDFRVTLIRFGDMRLGQDVGVGSLFALDSNGLLDALGLPIPPHELMVLMARGHATSGSIQLVSRSLGERLLRAFPSIYRA
jgi:hypothetical protein